MLQAGEVIAVTDRGDVSDGTAGDGWWAGFLADAPVSRIFRDAKLMEIGAGTSEIRRMLIGRELMAAVS